MKLLIVLLLASFKCSSEVIIKDQSDLLKLLKKSSHDIKILHENAGLRVSEIDKFKGSFHPRFGIGAKYSDDQKKPFISFQPQRTKNVRYETSISQKLMLGTKLSLGLTDDRTKLYGVSSSNISTTSNQQFHQPIAFFEVSFDLSKNLFGKMDRNRLAVLELLSANEMYNLLNGQQIIYFKGTSFLWNIRMIQEVVVDVMNYLEQLKKLEADIAIRINRKTAEPGDLYNLKATIAAKTADILGLNRNIQNVNTEMKKLLSSPDGISFSPDKSIQSVKQKIIDSENEILALKNNQHEWSSISHIANNASVIAARKYKNAELDSLPDIKLCARYARTGTDGQLSRSYHNLYEGINPQYSVGINLNWPISTTTYKAKRTIGRSQYNIANLNRNKLEKELQVQFISLKNEITDLRYESDQIKDALDNSIKLLDDLHIRYEQGRISLFELVIEEGKLLEIRIKNKTLWVDRINTLIAFYSVYDLYKYNNKFI